MPVANAFLAPKAKPLILGHRGVPLRSQENTMAALRLAVELGIDGVEFDVMLTRDRKVVLFHDTEMERLTGVKGRIADFTWDQLSKLRIQRTLSMGRDVEGKEIRVTYEQEEPIALLEEVFSEFGGKLLMNVELKPPAPNWSERSVGAEVARIIRRAGVEDSVIVTSFDFFKLMALEREHSVIDSGFAYDDNFLDFAAKWLKWIPELRSGLSELPGNQNPETLLNLILEANLVGEWIGSSVIDFEHTLADSDTVERLHDQDLAVGVYTIFPLDMAQVKIPVTAEEDEQIARRMVAKNVDWIETDDPEKLQEIRA